MPCCDDEGKKAHLLLHCKQLSVDRYGNATLFERLEVALQGVAGKLVLDLRVGFELALVGLDALLHPRERLEGALLGQRGHRLLDALLRLGATLARHEQVLLALGFLDLVIEVTQLVLELVRIELVRFPRCLELLAV